jgi:hypothetical protein
MCTAIKRAGQLIGQIGNKEHSKGSFILEGLEYTRRLVLLVGDTVQTFID